MTPRQEKTPEHCTTCGMANVSEEFHPHALCLLVKARNGDTAKARSDMAFIIRAAQEDSDVWLSERVATFLRNQAKETANG